jgi:UDPglucose--hexose-1-phosphate uridylyltransferase
MAELRKCPLTGQWRLVGGTPTSGFANSGTACPFCPGNEHLAPPEITAFREHGSPTNFPGWKVRAVPNTKPVLVMGGLTRSAEGLYDIMSDKGADELIIETPEHGVRFSAMPQERIQDVLWMYRHRILNLKEDPQIRQVLVFRDEESPESRHPHSQVLGMPFVPARLVYELNQARHHYRWKERCVLCDILAQEVRSGRRIVAVTQLFVALVPFAPRFEGEMWILPRAHHPFFEDHLTPALARDLAATLKGVMGAYEAAYPGVDWSYTLHTGPNTRAAKVKPDQWGSLLDDYHWHIEVVPMNGLTKLEKRSGLYSTVEAPEAVAERLRAHLA